MDLGLADGPKHREGKRASHGWACVSQAAGLAPRGPRQVLSIHLSGEGRHALESATIPASLQVVPVPGDGGRRAAAEEDPLAGTPGTEKP